MKEVNGDGVQIVYRCTTCNLVLKQDPCESPPLYCPNCAILHLKGEMIRAWADASGKRHERARTREGKQGFLKK